MKKRDIVLLSVIAGIVVLLFGVYLILSSGSDEGVYITVEVNGEETARYYLTDDGEYSLNGGTNTLRIENGEAYLTDATCPDHSCVKSGRVKATNPIVCLPNKLIITVHGVEDDVDIGVN